MNILKSIKKFLFPKKYNGFEIAEMGKNIKIDYTLDVIGLIANSTMLTEEEKEQTIYNMITAMITTGKVFSKSNYLYLKSKTKSYAEQDEHSV